MAIPTNLRSPILAAEFDSSRAFQGAAILEYQGLIAGGRTVGGSVAEAVITRATTADQVAQYFGRGSELHAAAVRWFQNNKFIPTFFAGLDDAGAAVVATGTHVFTGPAAAAGAIYLYIAGLRIAVAVASGDTATEIGDAVALALGNASSTGTATAGAAQTITLAAGESSIDDYNIGAEIRITGGIGIGQVRTIQSYVGSTKIATVTEAWDVNPDATSVYLVNASQDFLVTAANSTGTVTYTAKNKGEHGNSIDIRLNLNDGEELPAGVGVTPSTTIVAMASGATNPDIQDIIDVIGDDWFQIISAPYVDTTNLNAMKTFLDSQNGSTVMMDSIYISAKDGTLSALATFGNGRNNRFESVSEAKDAISSPFELAAAIAGQVAAEGSTDPARPFQTLELAGIVPSPKAERFTYTERNSLLFDGIATIKADAAGVVHIDRTITTYQKNAVGGADVAYLDVNTILSLMYIRWDWVNYIGGKYPRHKLADDNVRAAAGQPIMTPKIGKAEAVARFRVWEDLGIVENIDQFKDDLICQRSSSDVNRLEWTLPPDLVNQFRVGATTIQFLLQSPTS